MVIIFWIFDVYQILLSPQVKRSLIISNKLVYKVVVEIAEQLKMPSNLKLRILEF